MKIRDVFLKLIIAAIASLPFRILYIFSDLLAFVMQYVIGYRKDVVIQNLENSFPHKDTLMIERKKVFRTLLSLKDKLFTVRNNPDNWLWSHRRWKKREEKPN